MTENKGLLSRLASLVITEDFELSGDGRVYKVVPLEVPSLDYSTAAQVPSFGSSGGFPFLKFDDTLIETVKRGWRMPPDIDLSENPVIRLYVAPAVAQTVGSDFYFEASMQYVADGEDAGGAFAETPGAAVTVSDVADTLKVFDITLDASLMALEDLIGMKLQRDPTNGSDDRNGNATLYHVEFRYLSNGLGE